MSTRNDVISLTVECVDIATVTNAHLSVDREVVLLVGLRPEDHLAVPEGSNDPKLALT